MLWGILDCGSQGVQTQPFPHHCMVAFDSFCAHLIKLRGTKREQIGN